MTSRAQNCVLVPSDFGPRHFGGNVAITHTSVLLSFSKVIVMEMR